MEYACRPKRNPFRVVVGQQVHAMPQVSSVVIDSSPNSIMIPVDVSGGRTIGIAVDRPGFVDTRGRRWGRRVIDAAIIVVAVAIRLGTVSLAAYRGARQGAQSC